MTPLEQGLDLLSLHLTEFVRILEDEAKALSELNSDQLESLIDSKNRQARETADAWGRFTALFNNNPKSLDMIQQALPAYPDLQAKWKAVRKLAERAARLNQDNGALIEAQMRRTRQALNVLQAAANPSNVYGANGQMLDFLAGQRTLDKA